MILIFIPLPFSRMCVGVGYSNTYVLTSFTNFSLRTIPFQYRYPFNLAHPPTEANFFSIGLPTKAFVQENIHLQNQILYGPKRIFVSLFYCTELYFVRLGSYQSIVIILNDVLVYQFNTCTMKICLQSILSSDHGKSQCLSWMQSRV